MRSVLALAVLSTLAFEAPAKACGPQDAPVFLWGVGDDFVFVSRETLVRVTAPANVVHRRDIGYSSALALLPDGHTLVRAVGDGESLMSCVRLHYRFDLLDTTRRARRRLGTFPPDPDEGTSFDGFALVDGVVHADLTSYSDGATLETRTRVRLPERGRGRVVSRTEVDPAEEAARTPPYRHANEDELIERASFGPLTAAATWTGDARLEVRAGDRTLVTLRTTREVVDAAFAARGRYLGVATYEVVNEDYGTGFDARLDVVDLRTGEVSTPHGEASGVTNVAGRVSLTCELRVDDPDSPLNVRRAPRGDVVGTLPHDTVVTVAESRGPWRRLSAPREGWVWHENLTERCRLP